MGVLDKVVGIFTPKNEVKTQECDPLLRALLNEQTITREKAMCLPRVASNVDFIGSMVSTIPIKLYKETNGKIEEIKKDNRINLLNDDTGDTLDATQWKKAMVEDYLMGKGAYTYVNWKRNDIASIHYVECEQVTPRKNNDPIFKKCDFMINTKYYPSYQILRVLRKTRDGITGQSLVDQVSKAIETAYSTMLYELFIVKKGGNKKGFLTSETKLTDEAIKNLKASWRKLYSTNEENVVILNKGMDFKESSNSSVEMQLNQSKVTLNNDIDAIFHIKNSFEDTYKEAIRPILIAFESAINRYMLLEAEKKNGFFFAFDIKEITRATLKERFEAYKLAKEIGMMTLNEFRYEENLNNIDGLDVVNVGLGAVLYDINKKEYYTPNTGDTYKSDNNPDSEKEENKGNEKGGEKDE